VTGDGCEVLTALRGEPAMQSPFPGAQTGSAVSALRP